MTEATIALPLTAEATSKVCDAIMDVLVEPGSLRPGFCDADVSATLTEGQITVHWQATSP